MYASEVYQRFRVWCSIWNIVEVGILSTEPGGTFDCAENNLSKEWKVRKPTIYKASRRFLIWRKFLQNEEKMERKTDWVQMRIDKKINWFLFSRYTGSLVLANNLPVPKIQITLKELAKNTVLRVLSGLRLGRTFFIPWKLFGSNPIFRNYMISEGNLFDPNRSILYQ